ncbi:hypothetical protein [Paraburkholderia oxyphila]|nr:hypothetical protein [Paraburkholderia oxyphila]
MLSSDVFGAVQRNTSGITCQMKCAAYTFSIALKMAEEVITRMKETIDI